MLGRYKIRDIASIAHAAPSADNSQPAHFTWDGENLFIGYDTQRLSGNTFAPDSPATLMAMGAAIENLSSFSRDFGLDIKIELFSSQAAVAKCTFSEIEHVDKVERLYADSPILKRHTNRFAYQRDPVPNPVLEELSRMVEGSARTALFSSSRQINTVAELAGKASEVRFQTREVHEWLASSLRFSDEEVRAGDGLDVKTLGLPPGGIQFLKFTRDWRRMSLLNKLGAYRLMAKMDAGPLKLAPAIAAVCAPATAHGAIDAGRLLTRAWIYLNGEGVAVQPYYVISDQLTRLSEGGVPENLTQQVEELRGCTKTFFELVGNETLYMLLRMGYPAREAPRSLRVPISKVFTDLSSNYPES